MNGTRTVTLVTVTYNALAFARDFLNSVKGLDLDAITLDVVVVDNGSSDGTADMIRGEFPEVRVLENDENNYARALNLGIASSEGEFVVIANNDATVHPGWLQGFFNVFDEQPRAGAAQSKIFFEGKDKINSVGVEEIEHFYFRDIAFDEPDSKRYAKPARRDYVTGGSVMFRRACLDEVGPWDEEFIMFMEDVDYSARTRTAGWELWLAPDSMLYHRYHGSASEAMCEYFCTRNRFLFVAKHFPLELAGCIPGSHFFKKGEYDLVYRSLLHAVRRMCTLHDTETVQKVLESLQECLPNYLGEVSAYSFFSHLEVLLGLRRIRVGIYDHAGHFAGGGQRYVAEMAQIMQDRYDITYIFNNDVTLADYKDWFDIDLTPSSMKIIRIPFFEERQRYTPDEGMVLGEPTNPFDIIARETLNYDIFINANMLGKVNPLSPQSIFVCHFPDQEKTRFFQVDQYDHLIINGDYTGSWVRKRWDLEPTEKLYPPVNMFNPESTPEDKEKIILSVARFEISGSKKQAELARSWGEMCRKNPEATAGWRLVMIGGSTPENTYVDEVEEAIVKAGNPPVEIIANAELRQIRDHYRRASIFWHACGLDEERPERVEHFGMTTVESMQNCCVPVVIDGGGQREIVVHGECGYRFGDLEELKSHTLKVMTDPDLRLSMARSALERSKLFGMEVFKEQLFTLLDQVDAELMGRDLLPMTRSAS